MTHFDSRGSARKRLSERKRSRLIHQIKVDLCSIYETRLFAFCAAIIIAVVLENFMKNRRFLPSLEEVGE